jgi:2-polyprenyl-3-methyl-5-hydroxy-6-metoxy-1,4-benzoquinol methylase
MRTGLIGGPLADHLLRRFGDRAERKGYCDGSAYRGRSKLETLFGPGIWSAIAGKIVADFGCGAGAEVVEMAQHGAARVIGIDILEHWLEAGRRAAEEAGVADRCGFAARVAEPVDVVTSVDGFEHFGDPADVLRTMSRMITPTGRVLLSFGPTWLHPLGGHTFSVFPWAHLIFTERALLRWRSRFKHDGATRFGEVEGGLNQMTIRRFRRLVSTSPLQFETFEAVPIRRLRAVANRVTREFVTGSVRCSLRRRDVS